MVCISESRDHRISHQVVVLMVPNPMHPFVNGSTRNPGILSDGLNTFTIEVALNNFRKLLFGECRRVYCGHSIHAPSLHGFWAKVNGKVIGVDFCVLV